MCIPPNDSVIWIYLRMFVISSILYIFCSQAYANHFNSTDVCMIVSTVGSVIGIDIVKRKTAKKSNSESSTDISV